MNDREAIIELAKRVDECVVALTNELAPTIRTGAREPVPMSIAKLQAFIDDLDPEDREGLSDEAVEAAGMVIAESGIVHVAQLHRIREVTRAALEASRDARPRGHERPYWADDYERMTGKDWTPGLTWPQDLGPPPDPRRPERWTGESARPRNENYAEPHTAGRTLKMRRAVLDLIIRLLRRQNRRLRRIVEEREQAIRETDQEGH